MKEELKNIVNELLKDEEYFDLVSKLCKKYYDSLIKQGFSKKEAIEIVANLNLKFS